MTMSTRGRVVIVLVMTLSGCSFPEPAEYARDIASDPRPEVTRVDLLARGFLFDSQRSTRGYAYYAYLLFATNDPATAGARRSAAAAYLDMFRGVREAEASGVPKKNMAVFYAPLVGFGPARDLDAMLGRYNYDRARLVVNSLRRANRTVPDIAIVACRQPLDYGVAVDNRDVAVVDLLVGDVRVRLQTFQDKLEAGQPDLNQSGENAVLRAIRSWFELVGAAEESVSKIVAITEG